MTEQNKKSHIVLADPSERVDFMHARFAPVISCVVMHAGRMLLVKRSEELDFYPGVWNGISGFLDDQKDLIEKIHEELSEEAGFEEDDVSTIRLGDIFHDDDPAYNKTWIVHPVLVEVMTDRVRLNQEADEYRWIDPNELQEYDIVPNFLEAFEELAPFLP